MDPFPQSSVVEASGIIEGRPPSMIPPSPIIVEGQYVSPPHRLTNTTRLQDLGSDVERAENEAAATEGVPAAATGGGAPAVLARPLFVAALPFEIQRGFRIKMLTILFMQLCLTLAVAYVARFAIPGEGIAAILPAQSGQALGFVALVVFSLPLLSCMRDRHPWNMVLTFVWSICLGVAIAACQIPGAFVRPGILFIIFSSLTVGVGIVLILSTSITYTDKLGSRQLLGFGWSGLIAYVFILVGVIVLYTQVPTIVEDVSHFAAALVFATILFAWVCYDAGKLCHRMVPDDYMKGVIYFYTDFIYVCLCCALLSCLGNANAA